MAIRTINDSDVKQVEELTQQSVRDVFQSMVSMNLSEEAPEPFAGDSEGQIVGCVGFAGDISGVICIYAGLSFAKKVTGTMLGIADHEVDSEEMVNDAIGELSNMVAGSVKSRLCDKGWPCTLTIPSIVRGQKLSVERSADIIRKVIGFKNATNAEQHIVAELLLKQN
jgi:chemotaxis protein CheX